MLPKKPRIAPLDLNQMTDEQFALGGGRGNPFCELNLFRTLVQHPALLKSYTPFAMQLGQLTLLPFRDKEILIFRTTALCREIYETAHHPHIAHQAGMTDADIKAAREGGPGLSPFEQTLVRAADELVKDHCLSDKTWAELAQRYSQMQMMEVVFMVANYTLMAMVTNSLGIQPEDDVENAWKPSQAKSP